MSKKKGFWYYKHWYKVHKELHTHYEQLYRVAMKELRFAWMQKAHLRTIVDEIDELSKKKVKHSLISAVIDNWLKREMIDYSIHFDLECWGIDNCSFKKPNL